jgi:ABC-type multidrug transport system ATPase subunit
LDLDSGSAKISGMNVATHMHHLRKRMGVCPQFDILWDELTAYEHMKMFGELKKIPNLESEI